MCGVYRSCTLAPGTEFGDLDALDEWDELYRCPDCGELWPVTESIRADGSLGCPCQEVV